MTIPIYEIDEQGRSQRIAQLHAVWPQGFFVEGLRPDCASGFHADLPYFLHELRPAGFLGRLVPQRYPELGLPRDIAVWTADQTLRFLVRHGSDLPGSLVLGDDALRQCLDNLRHPSPGIPVKQRARRYPALALDVLASGPAGSSAAGEQPKFLTSVLPGPRAVLVKFSPPAVDRTSRRIADLLWAEHLALETLARSGHSAAPSRVVTGGDQVFLEVERFDRTSSGGRRGVLSIFALDAEFVGQLRSWSHTAAELARQRLVTREVEREIRWREAFGMLIGNTDMHAGNLAFFTRGTTVLDLCPTYDMSPMAYFPYHGHLRDPEFAPSFPEPADATVWASACAAAETFWEAVVACQKISVAFRHTARRNVGKLAAVRAAARLLPDA